MATPNIKAAESLRIKESTNWAEKDIQDLIANDPEVLGLGRFSNVHRELTQPTGGRIDLILSGDQNSARYVVEIQLGHTDPSHIIRTIEYWDNERTARPHTDHIAVIIAEDFNKRFYNIIHLFSQHIPLIAVKMTAIRVADQNSIIFTKVLDLSTSNDRVSAIRKERSTAPEATGLPDHVSGANRELMEKLVELAAEVAPNLPASFHQNYTSIKSGTRNRFSFLPSKNRIRVVLHVHQTPEMDNLLESINPKYVLNPTREVTCCRLIQKSLRQSEIA